MCFELLGCSQQAAVEVGLAACLRRGIVQFGQTAGIDVDFAAEAFLLGGDGGVDEAAGQLESGGIDARNHQCAAHLR